MKVVAVNSEAGGWDSFVESAQDATPYHQLRWRDVITKSFGHPCYYLAAIDDKGECQGVLPLYIRTVGSWENFVVSVGLDSRCSHCSMDKVDCVPSALHCH